MIAYFFTTIGQVAALFIMMAVGYILAKIGKLKEHTLSQISFLIMSVVCPSVIIDIMQMEKTQETLSALGKSAAAFGAVYIVLILLLPLIYRKQPDDTKKVLRFGAIYGNLGFIGIPLIDTVYGDPGMLYCVPSLVCYNMFLWSQGVTMVGGAKQASVKSVVTNPGIIAIIIGVTMFLTGLSFPAPLKSAVSYVAGMNTPLSLVLVGGQMAYVSIKDTFKDTRIFSASGLKLIVVPAIAALLLYPMKLEPLMYSVVVLMIACPSAGLTSIFAQRFDRDIASGARVITMSTLLSGITTPLWATLMLAITGAG